jgi:hypothetical protein
VIVEKVLHNEPLEEKVLFKDGLCVAIEGIKTHLPIFIRRTHDPHTLPMFKEAMKKTAMRLYPDMLIDEPNLDDLDHYYFIMRPAKEKKG